jgi:superfamily I DNA/RNA helicase
MTTKKLDWSPQQQAFIDWAVNGSGSCVLRARAGAGKTTVLLAAGAAMAGQVAYTAYNRKIVDETKVKLKEKNIDWKKMQANTAHGFGLGAYRKARPGVRVDEYKIRALIDNELSENPTHPMRLFTPTITQLISLAKQSAFGILGSMNDMHRWFEMAEHYDVFDEDDGPISGSTKESVIKFAQNILAESNTMLDIIDFDDMIYMPLLHRVRFWQFDVVMVDEAQDTNAARRALVRAMVKKGGRVIAVGDDYQAIYGFTGADADALDLIARDFNCQELPLTVSYRCPQAVVKFAQQWVNDIQHAPTAVVGEVRRSTMVEFLKRNDLTGGTAVLSRVNKPLVALAFRLIRQRIPCRVEGRDIASRIVKLIQRWKVKSLDGLEKKLDTYLEKETVKLLAKKQEAKLAEVEDAVETVRVVIDQCRLEKKTQVQDAVDYVNGLFADNVKDMLVLSSIHKSKGREWQRVFWLDRHGTCPSKWARQAWQQEQERNLMYVAATRAQELLVDLEPAPKEAA